MTSNRGAAPPPTPNFPTAPIDLQASDKQQGINTLLRLTVYPEAAARMAQGTLTPAQLAAVNADLYHTLRAVVAWLHIETDEAIQRALALPAAPPPQTPGMVMAGVSTTGGAMTSDGITGATVVGGSITNSNPEVAP